MASLTLRNVEKALGGNPILRGIDLDAEDGELVVLVGPSGCGKSTLLRTIAGLEIPDSGSVTIGERDVTKLPPRDRDVAMVFQSYALYPHLNVRDNLAFGLKLRGESKKVIDARVREVAGMLGLDELLDRYPRQMSGGQRQRVAMGRAIVRKTGRSSCSTNRCLISTRQAAHAKCASEIKKLHAQVLASTVIYVTHDQVEAMTLADQLVVLRKGEVEQAGPPLEVYRKPASRFVASFMGSPAMNFVEAEVDDRVLKAAQLELPLPDGVDVPKEVLLGIRPHDVLVSEGEGAIRMVVEVVEAMGFEAYAHGEVGGTPFVARVEGEHALQIEVGQELSLDVEPDALHLFDRETERAIGR